jgi:hypothetical protein
MGQADAVPELVRDGRFEIDEVRWDVVAGARVFQAWMAFCTGISIWEAFGDDGRMQTLTCNVPPEPK